MITVPATQLQHNFSLYTSTGSHGKGILATFHGKPLCLVGPCSMLTASESARAESVSATEAYRNLSELASFARDGRITIVTSHGKQRCCIVPPGFLSRLPQG